MTNTNENLQVDLYPVLNINGLKVKRDDDAIWQESAHLIDLCEQWITEYCKPRKTINDGALSYHLKHVVERWADTYVTNATFIHAAIRLGYTYENAALPGQRLSPNAVFRMSLPRKRTQPWKDSRLGDWL